MLVTYGPEGQGDSTPLCIDIDRQEFETAELFFGAYARSADMRLAEAHLYRDPFTDEQRTLLANETDVFIGFWRAVQLARRCGAASLEITGNHLHEATVILANHAELHVDTVSLDPSTHAKHAARIGDLMVAGTKLTVDGLLPDGLGDYGVIYPPEPKAGDRITYIQTTAA